MVDITGSTGDPWRVTISRVGDGHVIHLHVGNVMVVLPALEAHKLGSALHAASGLDDEAREPRTPEEWAEWARGDGFDSDHQDETGPEQDASGGTTMCSTAGDEDIPAVGEAWCGDEDLPNEMAPYCNECLTVLGADYSARWWDHVPLNERQRALAEVGKAALRAHAVGIPVSFRYETGQWIIGDAGRLDEDSAVASFARARSLLGQRVKATLARNTDDPAAIAEGRLLRICDGGEMAIEGDDGFVYYCWPMLDIEAEGAGHRNETYVHTDEELREGLAAVRSARDAGHQGEDSAVASTRKGEGGAPLAVMPAADGVPAVPAAGTPPDDPVDVERRRLWAAIQGWVEIAHRLDDDGTPVAVDGAEFKPLAPFFDELHAMVFPDEYLTEGEVRHQLDAWGEEWREAERRGRP